MLEYARWKYVVAALILAISAIYALPNLFPQDPAVQVTASRGGTVDAALKLRVEQTLQQQKIPFKRVDLEERDLLVRLTEVDSQSRAADALRTTLGTGYVVALNLASTVPAWLEAIGAKPMLLGLDLQGGVHFLMEVDQAAARDKREEALASEIVSLLRENKIYAGVNRAGGAIRIELRSAQDAAKARELIGANLIEANTLGQNVPVLDLQEASSGQGITLVGRLRDEVLRATSDSAIEQNLTILRNRINELGVAEPIIQRQGANRIVVQLPGVQDTAQAKKIIGATATLEYREVIGQMANRAFVTQAQRAQETGSVPPDARLYHMREQGPDGKPLPILLSKRVIASGDQLTDARSGFDPESGSAMVSVRLNAAGGARMADFTGENVGTGMAVVFISRTPETRVVDGKEVRTNRVTEEVINAATIQGVFGRSFQTTGLDSPDEAKDLALLLRAGALAAPVDIVEERIVGPSLGKQNVERGLQAVLYSFGFVLLFFLVYYKLFGLVTNIALLLNLLLVVAVMSILGATLTLPGLAGIALTVGLSVDANVLINERIREELRAGNTPLASIAAGYDKAAGTIADANVTALLAGVALWVFGSGPVVGFGVTLIVGILTSMYTAVSVSRGVATLIYSHRRRKVTKVSI